MKKNELYQKCVLCKGAGKTKKRLIYNDRSDTKKMVGIMKRNKISQTGLAKILNITQSTVSGWLSHRMVNFAGINKKYFDMLKSKGYK